MKILQICSYYVDSPLYQNLFSLLEKKGLEEDAYVFAQKGYVHPSEPPQNVHISGCFSNFDRYIFHLKHGKVYRDLKKHLDPGKYSLSHSHSLFSNGYIAYRLFREFNIPYITAVRNTDINFFFEKLRYLNGLGLKILNNAEKIIFLCAPYKTHLTENIVPDIYKKDILEKSVVLTNGIDDLWFDNIFRGRKPPEAGKIRFVYAGRIYKNKNIETVLRVCGIMRDRGYEVSLKVIGRIIDPEYNNLIESEKIIEYIPFCSHNELIGHYRDSDIFIMPSKKETFGLVYAEAMTQGLPVIYTKDQGFDGNFEDGEVGFAVPYLDADYIASCVEKILDDYAGMSLRCVEKSSVFNWDGIADRYLRIYSEAEKRK